MKKVLLFMSVFLPMLCMAQQRYVSFTQVNQLIDNTYVYAVIVSLIALALSCLVASFIPYEGGEDKSYIKRRFSYLIIMILEVFGFFLYNINMVKPKIANSGFKDMFERANYKCLGITIGVYFVLSLIIMLCFRRSKFGSILGKVKD